MTGATYDRIGRNYADLRRPDPRIAQQIAAVLGDARSVVNVGAGAGSYEPDGMQVTAVEPSAEMTAQRRVPAARVVQGVAEALPFDDNTFDAAMAVLTVHHWTDKAQGLREMRRVARGPVVVLSYDPGFRDFWLLDYFPGLVALDEQQMPAIADYASWMGDIEIHKVPIPHDCTDGFLSAYWRRPDLYLDPALRAAMSSFWMLDDVDAGVERLATDLQSGTWQRRHGHVMAQDARDCGYRLVVARQARSTMTEPTE